MRTQTGFIGLAITLFSATSFARALQRMQERVWQRTHVGGVAGSRRCFVWLAGWLVLLQMIALVGTVLGLGGLARTLIQAALGCLVWWWSAHMLLLGRETWRRLLPGAVITGVGVVLYSTGSGLLMPRYAESSAAELGALGLVLAMATWLIGLAVVLVAAAVLGRVMAEDDRVHEAVRSLRLVRVLQAGRSNGRRAPIRRRPTGRGGRPPGDVEES